METLNKTAHFRFSKSKLWSALAPVGLSILLTLPARANMNGHATQTFSPAMGSQDFATVQSARTVQVQNYNLGVFVNHAADTLPYEKERQSKLSNTLTSMDLLIGYGLTRNVEVGMIAPFAIAQSVSEQETHSEFFENGNTELRPYVKAMVFEKSNFGLGLQGNLNFNRMVDNPYSGGGSSFAGSFEIAADWSFSGFRLGTNLGYRYAPKGKELEDALVSPTGDRYLASVGVAISAGISTNIIAETYGSSPVRKFQNQTDRSAKNLETLLGLQQNFTARTKGQIGITSEVLHGINTADWRVYLGVNQLIGPAAAREPRPVIAKKKPLPKPIRDFVARPDTALVIAEPPMRNEPRELTPAQVPAYAPFATFVLRDVHFEFDSDHQILSGGIAELDKVGTKLRATQFDQIVVEGHCDYFGSDDYNDQLSMRRSRNVARHLIQKYGIDSTRMSFVGFGERKPKSRDPSDFGRKVNRRVEIKIYRNGSLELSSQ